MDMENVTRVRLVQFQKNTDEPMVWREPQSLSRLCTGRDQYYNDFNASFCTLKQGCQSNWNSLAAIVDTYPPVHIRNLKRYVCIHATAVPLELFLFKNDLVALITDQALNQTGHFALQYKITFLLNQNLICSYIEVLHLHL